MDRLRRLLGLSWPERRLLAGAFLLVAFVRLGLSVLPFATLRRLLARTRRERRLAEELHAAEVERIEWAVSAAARFVPAATCLTQALATEWLLARIAEPADLRIGVRRAEDGKLMAHAWVVCRGRVVAGRVKGLSRYTVLRP